MVTKIKMVVFAYHEVGYRCLEWLLSRNEKVEAVFTHEDSPGENIWFRSVAGLARAHGIPIFTPLSLKGDEVVNVVRTLAPDVIYSFYYRNMIPRSIFTLPSRGAFNMHGSLLPRYRGRVPINWAIIHGEQQAGATLHHMVGRADAGDIVDQEAVPIGPEDTAQDVFWKVTDAAVTVLARTHDAIAAGTARRVPQEESLATTYGARCAEDGRIAWGKPAHEIFNLVRAVTEPYPGAFSEVQGCRFVVWWGVPVGLEGVAHAAPGQVMSVQPLVIATGKGGFSIERLEWVHPHEVHDFTVGEFVGP